MGVYLFVCLIGELCYAWLRPHLLRKLIMPWACNNHLGAMSHSTKSIDMSKFIQKLWMFKACTVVFQYSGSMK